MGTNLVRNRTDLRSPEGAYEDAYTHAVRAVELERVFSGTVGASIDKLSRRGRFGSWLQKLYKRQKVSIHLHYYETLVDIVIDLADRVGKQADHYEMLANSRRGTRDETIQGTAEPDFCNHETDPRMESVSEILQ